MLELYIEYTIARIGRTMDCRAARRVENHAAQCSQRSMLTEDRDGCIHPSSCSCMKRECKMCTHVPCSHSKRTVPPCYHSHTKTMQATKALDSMLVHAHS